MVGSNIAALAVKTPVPTVPVAAAVAVSGASPAAITTHS